MTDYKKLYEDANKRVATRFGSDVARELFPEFYELEDEKIRKNICKLLWDNAPYEEAQEYIAWLEKQGEKLPAWSEDDEIGLDDALWAIEQARTIAKDETDMGNLWYAEHFLNSIKDRVQSRPKQEWSEDDEHRSKDAIYFLETARKHYASTVEIDACIDWLKSLKDRI